MPSPPVHPSEMTTISTLCATSTVLVAPTGLTFARSSTPSGSLSDGFHYQQRRPLHHRSPPERHQQPTDSGTPLPNPARWFAPPRATALAPRPVTSSPGPPSAWNSNRSSLVREDIELSKPFGASPRDYAYTQQRPASSNSAQAVSRANTYSSSSTQPFITPAKPVHRPNKLVKRSLSQSNPNSAKHKESPSSKPLFRRPAPSRNRSASWSLNSGAKVEKPDQNQTAIVAAHETHIDLTAEQQPIHFPRVVTARRPFKGLGRQKLDTLPESFRRIRPDGSKLILLSAKSVLPAQVELEDAPPSDLDADWASQPSPSPSATRVISSSPLNPSSAQTSLRSERYRRQSFTYFRNSPGRIFDSSHSPASKLKRKLSQRISSAPTPSIGMGSSKPTEPEQGLLEPSLTQKESAGAIEAGTPPPVRGDSRTESTISKLRHVSISSGVSSSPEGSYAGHRVFSWGTGEDDGSTSDTVYDSFRTATTRSSYGTPRPPLETLFDKSSTTVDDQRRSQRAPSPSTFLTRQHHDSQQTFSTEDRTSFVSAHTSPQILTPRQTPPKRTVDFQTFQHYDRDFADDEAEWDETIHASQDQEPYPFLPLASPPSRLSASPSDFGRSSVGRGDPGLRNSVFDWSEPPPVDKGSDHETPPRPKTVHGKKRQGALGNPSSTRRTQAGLHARSQSVPAFQDLTGRRPDVTHKFGTWGVGGKGATEDWDDDFDFGQPSRSSPIVPVGHLETPVNNFHAMRIPENIQKQQNNVLANIGLLKEWGLLIEELKALRVRAAALGVRGGSNLRTFEEVDAMIDLADQEHEDDALSVLRSPSSSHFSDEDTDGFTPPRSLPAGSARLPPHEMLRAVQQSNTLHSSPPTRSPETTDTMTRPRKDSEAIAQSVIQALHEGRRRDSNPGAVAPHTEHRKKMPFDTATLKHIVPYVNGLTRQVKELIRDAEGLNTSPRADRRTQRRGTASITNSGAESPSAQRELRQRLQRDIGSTPPSHGRPAIEDFDLEEQMSKMDMI